jgi:3-oxoacyl-[acyl-carrier-protein] synthase-3
MSASISALGQWLPETVRENSWWSEEFKERALKRNAVRDLVDVDTSAATESDRLASRYFEAEQNDPFMGTTRRRIAPAGLTAPEAEALAAKSALAEINLAPQEIDAVFSWAAVPERIVPPSAPKVADILGAKRAYASGMDAGCATPLVQLDHAAALIETGRAQHVLLTQSHLITRAFPDMHPAAPNVGDAATAIIVSRTERPGIRLTHAVTHGEYYSSVTWCRGKQEADDPPWWQAGPQYYLGSHDSRAAHELVLGTVRIAAETIEQVLERSHCSRSEISVLASVQPRRWIPGAIAEALGVDWVAPQTFDDLAHLGGCGVVTNLIAARQQGLLKPGAGVILYAQGAGFTRGATLLRWL